jgi:HSP20 family protein
MAQEMATRGNQGGPLAQRRAQHPLQQLRQDFDAVFGPLLGGWFDRDLETMRVWDFDVKEDDKEITVRAEMPGFEENEVDVQINDNVLTIRAQKEQKGDGREEYRSFFRSVVLPTGIDADKAQATYRNGVLELHIPRAEGAGPKRIKLQGQQGASGQKAQASSGKSAGPGNGSKSNPAETKAPEKAQK